MVILQHTQGVQCCLKMTPSLTGSTNLIPKVSINTKLCLVCNPDKTVLSSKLSQVVVID